MLIEGRMASVGGKEEEQFLGHFHPSQLSPGLAFQEPRAQNLALYPRT